MEAMGELIRVNRNTAHLSASVVERQCASLLADDIAIGSYLFSFDPTIPENRQLVFVVDDESTIQPENAIVTPFDIVNWAVKKIVMPNTDTGEDMPCVRTTLINANCETLAFVSSGVVLSLDIIRMLWGDGPYNPPIPVTVKSIKTNRGFRLFKLMPVFPAAPKTVRQK